MGRRVEAACAAALVSLIVSTVPAFARGSGLYDFSQIYGSPQPTDMPLPGRTAQASAPPPTAVPSQPTAVPSPPTAPADSPAPSGSRFIPAGNRIGRGWYASAAAGVDILRDINSTSGGTTAKLRFSPGLVASAGGGFAFGNGFRAEVEVDYLRISFDSLSALGATVPLSGTADAYAGFLNGYYDINTGTILTPYVGAGAGGIHFSSATVSAKVKTRTVTVSTGSTNDFAVQGELGIGIKITDRIWLTPSYRYLWVNDGGSGTDNTQAHILRLGALYKF
jgi:opacity protein-like surface antigen